MQYYKNLFLGLIILFSASVLYSQKTVEKNAKDTNAVKVLDSLKNEELLKSTQVLKSVDSVRTADSLRMKVSEQTD